MILNGETSVAITNIQQENNNDEPLVNSNDVNKFTVVVRSLAFILIIIIIRNQ